MKLYYINIRTYYYVKTAAFGGGGGGCVGWSSVLKSKVQSFTKNNVTRFFELLDSVFVIENRLLLSVGLAAPEGGRRPKWARHFCAQHVRNPPNLPFPAKVSKNGLNRGFEVARVGVPAPKAPAVRRRKVVKSVSIGRKRSNLMSPAQVGGTPPPPSGAAGLREASHFADLAQSVPESGGRAGGRQPPAWRGGALGGQENHRSRVIVTESEITAPTWRGGTFRAWCAGAAGAGLPAGLSDIVLILPKVLKYELTRTSVTSPGSPTRGHL